MRVELTTKQAEALLADVEGHLAGGIGEGDPPWRRRWERIRDRLAAALDPTKEPANLPPNALSIEAFLHCSMCLDGLNVMAAERGFENFPAYAAAVKAGQAAGERAMSPDAHSRLDVGWTEWGLQVWCRRHQANVIHMDFEGEQHMATTTRE